MMRFLEQSVLEEDGKIPAASGCRQHGHRLKHGREMEIGVPIFFKLEEAVTRTAEKTHNGHV